MKKIQEIEQELSALPPEAYEEAISRYRDDERAGVQKLLERYGKKLTDYRKELKRIDEMSLFEKRFAQMGYICGIDEVGRGPLAGPVVACAVILPKDERILYLNDSKKLTPKKREYLSEIIKKKAVSWSLGMASPERIDEINILQATYEAMREAVAGLRIKPAMLLNDAVTIPGVDIEQTPIIKGDQKSVSIAAASIVAKVARDHMMDELALKYPEYHFEAHKGYGTAEHIEAIRRYGVLPVHRKSFLKNIQVLKGEQEDSGR